MEVFVHELQWDFSWDFNKTGFVNRRQRRDKASCTVLVPSSPRKDGSVGCHHGNTLQLPDRTWGWAPSWLYDVWEELSIDLFLHRRIHLPSNLY